MNNYLDKIFIPSEKVNFKVEEDGLVTIMIENKGVINRVFQMLFKKPKISYIHLDKMGSFVFKSLDGEATLFEVSQKFKEEFLDEAEPLYDRIVKYSEILKSYNLIEEK